MKFEIYTDGSCLGNKAGANCPGGYAYLILDSAGSEIERGGGKRVNVTNNQMEMNAVCAGLKGLIEYIGEFLGEPKDYCCTVYTDSKYVSGNYKWIEGWKDKGWKKTDKKPVLNKEGWIYMSKLIPEFGKFNFKWVRSHAGNKYNNIVDVMAVEWANKAKEDLLKKQ